MNITLDMIFPPRSVVMYVSTHGYRPEIGIVSSCGKDIVFVKFCQFLRMHNNNWYETSSIGIRPGDLVRLI